METKKIMLSFDKLFELMGVKRTGNIQQDISKIHFEKGKMAELGNNIMKFVFYNYDKNDNGDIENNELENFLQDISEVLGVKVTSEDWLMVVQQLGFSGNEPITQEIFNLVYPQILESKEIDPESWVNNVHISMAAFMKQNSEMLAATTTYAQPSTTTTTGLTVSTSRLSVPQPSAVLATSPQTLFLSTVFHYSNRVIKDLIPALRILGIQPSGNLLKDIISLMYNYNRARKELKKNIAIYMFHSYDVNGDLEMSYEEFGRFMEDMFLIYRECGFSDLVKEERQVVVKKMFETLDKDGSGTITLEEFLKVLRYQQQWEEESSDEDEGDDEQEEEDDEDYDGILFG